MEVSCGGASDVPVVDGGLHTFPCSAGVVGRDYTGAVGCHVFGVGRLGATLGRGAVGGQVVRTRETEFSSGCLSYCASEACYDVCVHGC